MRAAAAHASVSQAVAAIIGGMGGEWVAADDWQPYRAAFYRQAENNDEYSKRSFPCKGFGAVRHSGCAARAIPSIAGPVFGSIAA